MKRTVCAVLLSVAAHLLMLSMLPPTEAREEKASIRVSLRSIPAVAPPAPQGQPREVRRPSQNTETPPPKTARPQKAPPKPEQPKKPMERPQKPVENTDSRAPEVPEITESASSNGEPALDAQPFGASDVSPALPAAGGGTIIDVSSLTVSKKVLPEYPMISRKRRDQGTVTLIVTIRSGRVLSVEVERGSGHAPLDESAVRAARGWEFDSSGYGDTVTARIPFVFKLE